MVMLLAPLYVVVDAETEPDERSRIFVRIAMVGLVGLAGAAALAAVQARQLARPLERLARAAGRIGDGDFSAPATGSGIDEIDDISQSLRLSANRVDRMLESERSFTADATHQLRTGLTGLAIRLELLERHPDPEVAQEAGAILEQTHELNTALDELLTVTRQGSTGERSAVDLAGVVSDHVDDWATRFERQRRRIALTIVDDTSVDATRGLVGQIIDVLLDNALGHGGGDVSVSVEQGSVTVTDRGDGIPADRVATLFERPADHQAAHGRGLALARRLAESDAGRLELIADHPAQFRLSYVPATP